MSATTPDKPRRQFLHYCQGSMGIPLVASCGGPLPSVLISKRGRGGGKTGGESVHGIGLRHFCLIVSLKEKKLFNGEKTSAL